MAEDNCELVTGEDAKIEHALIDQFFYDFNDESSSFMPYEYLAFLYPPSKKVSTLNLPEPQPFEEKTSSIP